MGIAPPEWLKWTRLRVVAVEFITIVAGVLVALAVDEWRTSRNKVSFPAGEIERFYGTGHSLFIATSQIMVRAAQVYVQVLQVPEGESAAPWTPEA